MEPKELIENALPSTGERVYALGLFDSNITLYRQQIRALNLIYSMAKVDESNGGLNLGKRIAVIGAGAFGVTAATAGAIIGYDIRLYERHQVVLPFQNGCDTRWVNPTYYDWPGPGSMKQNAGLPILNWHSGTANQVAEQLEYGLHAEGCATNRLTIRTKVDKLKFLPETSGNFVVKCHHIEGQDEWRCDAIIIAAGFGVESELEPGMPPYWRNDQASQPQLNVKNGDRRPYLISGTGDGGLTDLARLTITGFRHERLFHELFGDANTKLLDRLENIRQHSFKNISVEPDWLFRKFEQIDAQNTGPESLYDIRERLRARLRTDTHVQLNGRQPLFRDSLDLGKVSLSNALLAYLLHDLGAFEYKAGELKKENSNWMLDGQPLKGITFDSLIMRHGTERKATLLEAGLSSNRIQEIQWREGKGHGKSSRRIFPAGWWSLNSVSPEGKKDKSQALETVPNALATLATTFVNTLSDVLVDELIRRPSAINHEPDSKPQFRLTLHRILRVGDDTYFQQITNYAGLNLNEESKGIGRVFTVSAGIGGLAIRYGRAVVFRRKTSDLTQMKSLTNFEELVARPIQDSVDSMFACPFFAHGKEKSQNKKVLFVLFADTSDKSFFDQQTLRTVYAACTGLVKTIESALDADTIKQINVGFSGFSADYKWPNESNDELRDVGITTDDEEFEGYEATLSFTSLTSTEIETTDRNLSTTLREPVQYR